MFNDKKTLIDGINDMLGDQPSPDGLEATIEDFFFFRDRLGVFPVSANDAAFILLLAMLPQEIKGAVTELKQGIIEKKVQLEAELNKPKEAPPETDWAKVLPGTKLTYMDGDTLSFVNLIRPNVALVTDESGSERQVKTDTIVLKS